MENFHRLRRSSLERFRYDRGMKTCLGSNELTVSKRCICSFLPFPSNLSAAPSKLPAMTTTDVVPSPASMSCAFARSTSIFAAGCMTLISLSIVFPSFV